MVLWIEFTICNETKVQVGIFQVDDHSFKDGEDEKMARGDGGFWIMKACYGRCGDELMVGRLV